MSDDHSLRLVVPTERFWPEYTGWVKQTLKLAQSAGDQLQFVSVSRPSRTSAFSGASEDVPSNVEICRRGPNLKRDGLPAKVAYVLSAAIYVVGKRHTFDVLYLPYVFFPGFVFILLGTLIGLPVAIRISGQEVDPNRSLPARLRFWSLQFVDAVVVLNKTDRQRVRELGVDDERVWFIPNGVDVKQFSPLSCTSVIQKPSGERALSTQEETFTPEQETSWEEDSRVVIGFAGTICRRKGVMELFDAYERICSIKNIPKPVLCIAGPMEGVEEVDPSFVKEVVGRVHLHGGDIQLLGKVDNMARFYHSLDLFVLPSYREGMPNVLLEAMATGLPCIATNIPGVQEIITSGRNGILVPPRNTPRLASVLYDLLRDRTLRKSLGSAARKKVVKLFSIKNMVDKYANLFVSMSLREQ